MANPLDKPAATYWVLDDLLRAIEEHRAPETSATDNLQSMRMMEAAYRSLEQNRVIDLKEIQ
jgi:predicted dehydrogenase